MSWNAGPSASSGVMSLNTMPGFGKSGMSRMRLRRSVIGPLYHILAPLRRPSAGGRREVEEWIPRHVVLADLEVEVRAGRLPGPPDGRDHLALPHLRAGPDAALLDVRVDGRIAVVVPEDHEVPVAAELVAVEDA